MHLANYELVYKTHSVSRFGGLSSGFSGFLCCSFCNGEDDFSVLVLSLCQWVWAYAVLSNHLTGGVEEEACLVFQIVLQASLQKEVSAGCVKACVYQDMVKDGQELAGW
mmetsp:Transcript_9464/g.16758  ORF Transcript_9464/g.16758 Transcript_9464/m.16758 type:complete len:109 (-) Transcript_9464:237-563(-)